MRRRLVLSIVIIFALLLSMLISPTISISSAQTSGNPLAVNTNEFGYYSTGLQSMFNTLLKPAPCGSGLTSISEAPSVTYNWWTDDNAKALGALSYVYPNFATQDSQLLNFVQHNTLSDGYLIKRCQQITPSIVNSSLTNMTVRNNLYILQGNPTLGLSNPNQLFKIFLNENPQIANAYIESQVASINNVSLALDTGISQVIVNGGFDGTSLLPWTGSGTTNTTYFRSPPNSLELGSSQEESQIFASNLQYNDSLVQTNMTLWATSGSQSSENYNAIVLYTDGTNSTIAETATPSTPSGTFGEVIIQSSQLTPNKIVKGIELSTVGTGGADVMIDDVSFYYKLFTPVFNVWQLGQNVELQESAVYQGVNITMDYTLTPNLPYVNVTTTLTNGGSSNVVSPTIYNAFDGLDSIGSGYSSLYFPGHGWERANQTINDITGGYLPGNWTQNWFAVGIQGIPDWIGNDGIFVNLNLQNMPNSTSGGFKLNQIFNTEFQNATFTSPGDYLHWLQMSFNDPGTVAVGQSISYQMKYIFVTSYDWTNMPLYSTFLDGSNIANWNNTNIGQNYYYGEVANDLALYSWATGAQSSPAYPTALSVWNYYYDMLHRESNGTYTASLARFVNASDILYKMTGNSTYLSAITYAANLLEHSQQEGSTDISTTDMYFHYDPGIPTIDSTSTFGAIFNTTDQMGVGKVYSGQTVSLNFFMSPVTSSQLNLTGTLKTVFYMNANTNRVTASYNTSLNYITSSGSSFDTVASSTQQITLPRGNGHPSFKSFESDITLSNYTVPAGASLVLHLYVNVPAGDTVYVLVDSTNGPSSITLPVSNNVLWNGAFTIPSPEDTAAIAAPQQQPYALDLTAISGAALDIAYRATGNASYLANAELALNAIHWGDAPNGFKLLGVPSNTPAATRLYSYVNSTYIDVDYSTYKSMLVADFTEGLNNTLANIAMSRVWDRSIVNSTFVQIDTGESTGPHIEMNSETQPWGLEAWLQYDLYWQQHSANGNFPLYVSFANEQDTLEIVSAQTKAPPLTSTTTWMVNGSGIDTFYDYTSGSSPSTVTFNGVPIGITYQSTTGGPIGSESYVYWQKQLGSPDNFTITFVSSSGSTSTSNCVASGTPLISTPLIYAQIGKTTTATATIHNDNNNVSTTIQGVTYVPPAGSGIQMVTQSGLPQTVQALSSGTFKISVIVSNSTKPGEYNVTATAPISEDCSGNAMPGQTGFTVQVIAQTGSVIQAGGAWWILFLETWWWALTIAIIVATGGVVLAVKRDEDGY